MGDLGLGELAGDTQGLEQAAVPGGCSRLRGSAGVMPHRVWVPAWGPYLGTSEAVTQLKLLRG